MDHMHRMQQMQQAGMNMPPGQGPPPPYFSSMNRRPGMPPGAPSPTSPIPNGPLPSPHLGSSGLPSPAPDPYMFPGPGGPGPRMGGPQGPFDPMGPMPDGMFMKDPMMNPRQLPQIHRAGNPEQFNPELPGGPGTPNSTASNKPPPSYAQSTGTKRKRSGKCVFILQIN